MQWQLSAPPLNRMTSCTYTYFTAIIFYSYYRCSTFIFISHRIVSFSFSFVWLRSILLICNDFDARLRCFNRECSSSWFSNCILYLACVNSDSLMVLYSHFLLPLFVTIFDCFHCKSAFFFRQEMIILWTKTFVEIIESYQSTKWAT